VARDFGDAIAGRAAFLLLLAPEAFFLLAPFSEATSLLAGLICFYAARRRKWGVVAVAGILAGLTRPVGIFLIVPVLVEVFLDIRRSRESGTRSLRIGHASVVAPVAGLLLFWVYVAVVLKIPGGPFGPQTYWHTHFEWPWTALWDSWNTVVTGHHFEELVNLLSALALIVFIPFMWKRLPAAYTAYTIAMLISVCFRESGTTPLMSGARYSIVIFPMAILGAKALKSLRVRELVYFALTGLQVAMFVLFVRSDFIG
jgi:hypothetical protein